MKEAHSTGPQSLIRNSLGQICFGIQIFFFRILEGYYFANTVRYMTSPDHSGAAPRNQTH